MRPIYNQKELVDKTMDTVREILLFSGGLVIVVLLAILMDIRSSLIVAAIIPLSLLFSFILMKCSGLSANLMTLGAVDFGVVVDAGVVVVENVFRRLASREPGQSERLFDAVLNGSQEVGRPVCFAIMIIIAVYIPLFTLEGIEGKMFIPLALTFVYALLGALIVSLTVIPMLCLFFLKKDLQEKHNPILQLIKNRYRPVLDGSIQHPKRVVVLSAIVFLAALPLAFCLGSEFMPSLDEGSILLRVRFPLSISHRKSQEYCGVIESLLKEFPEVELVCSKIGRSGMGSDAEGVDSADVYMKLTPRSRWKDRNKEHLIDRMSAKLSAIPGVMLSFSQPIADMVDDLVTGVKADVGIKIFGNDLHKLDEIAEEVRKAVAKVPGTADLSREPLIGEPELNIKLDRKQLARYGLLTGDVQDLIEAAIAGKAVNQVFEQDRRFDIMVRLKQAQRASAKAIGDILIQTPGGQRVPLRALADIKFERGALNIYRDDRQRRAAVMVNIRGRDLGSWVADAQRSVAGHVKLPKGYSVVWGGQFENQESAMSRLSVVIPIVLFVIMILLFFAFNSFGNAALIMLNVPFAATGGIIALWLTRQPVSVPSAIGFIAVFGVAVQNGVILTSCITQLEKAGTPTVDAIRSAALMRLRPILMTATVAIMGLLPKLLSDGTGAEIQRPLATVVCGGLLSSTATTLFLLPSAYLLLNTKNLSKRIRLLLIRKVADFSKPCTPNRP